MSVTEFATQTGAVSLAATTVCKFGPSGYVMMYLHGGPLDGEQQIVQGTVTVIGLNVIFNIPNYQSFAPDGATLVNLGLQVTYVVASQGAGPNVANGDTWDSSWNLNFVAQAFITPPSPIVPPIPPQPSPAVWMGAGTTLAVNADDPSPGVWMLDSESFLEVDATTQTVGWASVSMSGETTLIGTPADWTTNSVALNASGGLAVAGDNRPPIITNVLTGDDTGFEGGTTGRWNVYQQCTMANSTAQAHTGTHSLAITTTANGNPAVVIGGAGDVLVSPNTVYQVSMWFYPATTARVAVLNLWWFDAGGNVVASSTPQVATVAGQWAQLITVVTTPATVTHVQLMPYISSAVSGEVYYMDDVVVGAYS